MNKGDKNGRTAFQLAAKNGHLDVTKYLISQGAEVSKINNNGWTALHSAVKNGKIDVTKYLISQGAEINILKQHYVFYLSILMYSIHECRKKRY